MSFQTSLLMQAMILSGQICTHATPKLSFLCPSNLCRFCLFLGQTFVLLHNHRLSPKSNACASYSTLWACAFMPAKTRCQLHMAHGLQKPPGPNFQAVVTTFHANSVNASDDQPNRHILGFHCPSLKPKCVSHLPQPFLFPDLPMPAWCISSNCTLHACAS